MNSGSRSDLPLIIMHLGHLEHATTGTPEGLSRVEYRYARFLLDRGLDTIWVRRDWIRGDLVVVAEEQVRALVTRIGERWRSGGEASASDVETGLDGAGFVERWRRRLRQRVRDLDPRHPLRVLPRQLAELARHSVRAYRILAYQVRWQASVASTHGRRRDRRILLSTYLDSLSEPAANRPRWHLDVSQLWVVEHPAEPSTKRQPGSHQVVMLHDLIPIDAPELTPDHDRRRFERGLSRMLDANPTVMTNSAETASRLRAYVLRRGLPVPHIMVNELGTELLELAPPERDEPEPPDATFVVLGTIGPRKNHALLLTVWRHLLDEGHEPGVLEIVGRRWRAPGTAGVLDVLDRPGRLQPWLREHAALGDDDLIRLLRRSRALLLPSFMEGWGMPVAEALSLGVPVICSDLPSFREIGGDIPRYLSPLDGLGWRQAVLDYRDPDHPDRQRQRALLAGGAFRPRTWDEHLTRFEQVVLAQQADHRDTPPS